MFFFYDTALRFVNQFQNIVISALAPLLPAASELNEIHGYEMVEKLRKKSTKYIIPVSIFACSIILFITPCFVRLWLGDDKSIIATAIQIITISSFFMSLTFPPYIILNGLGFAKDTLMVQILSGFANITGIIVLTYLFGFYGFCFGYTIAMIFGFFSTNYYYKKRLKVNVNFYEDFFKKNIIFFSVILILFEFLMYEILNMDSYFEIFVFSFIVSLVFFFLVWKFEIINENDLKSLFGNDFLNKIRNLRKSKFK